MHLAAVLAVVAFASHDASAAMVYSFNNITNNNAVNVVTGESQLTVEVADAGPNLVSFRFENSGPLPSSITQIYFDDGALLAGLNSITEGPGTDYRFANPQPGNLPGGNPIDFNESAGLSIEPNSPTQPNGVNPFEFVIATYTLQPGVDFDDIIAALNLSLSSPGTDVPGGLRIGIHVQGFANGGSESFVNGPPGFIIASTPEPASFATVGIATLLGLGWAWRKRNRAVS